MLRGLVHLLKKLIVLATKIFAIVAAIVMLMIYCQMQSPERPVTVFQPLGFSYWVLMDSDDLKDTKYSRGDIIFMRRLKEYHTNDDIVFETLQGDYYLGSVTQKWSSLYKVFSPSCTLNSSPEKVSEPSPDGVSNNVVTQEARNVEVTQNKIKGKIVLHLELSKVPGWSA